MQHKRYNNHDKTTGYHIARVTIECPHHPDHTCYMHSKDDTAWWVAEHMANAMANEGYRTRVRTKFITWEGEDLSDLPWDK